MATLFRAYPSEAAARRAIEGLRAAGLPPQGAHLITGTPFHDVRGEMVGEFANRAGPQAPVGTFGNTTLQRRRASGGFAGDPDRQRLGSFADVDRDVIVRYDPGGREHPRVAGARGLVGLFTGTGLERDAAERALADLGDGSSLVLVQIAEFGPADAAARLEEAGRAA